MKKSRKWVRTSCWFSLLTVAIFLNSVIPDSLVGQQRRTTSNGYSISEKSPERSGGSYKTSRRFNVPTAPKPIAKDLGAELSRTIGVTFDGFDFDDNPTVNNGFSFIPPDPMTAAGMDRLVSVVNTMIEMRDKLGTAIVPFKSLQDFFSPLGGLPTTLLTATFDPKVIYDQYENRFLVVTLEQTDASDSVGAVDESRILLAVSKTGTPATLTSSDWYFHSIDSKEDIDLGPPDGVVSHWADYPGFEVDEEAVYITNSMFSFSSHTGALGGIRLWIVDKGVTGGFYGGGSAAVTIHDPIVGAGLVVTTMPAHVFGSGGVPGGTGSIGTFLVGYSSITTGGVGGTEAVQVVRVDDPLGASGGPTFTQEFVNVGDIEDVGGSFGFPALPDAPQMGCQELIEVNDSRALDAVWRDNALWLVTTINPNSGADAGHTTAHWFKLNTSAVPGSAITVDDQGDIGGEDIAATTSTFFPSVAVNSAGTAKFGFSASATTIFGGAYVTGRASADPAGTVRASETVRAGVDSYHRDFGGTRNRWGDYSGISLDPSDDSIFWVFNQYADFSVGGTCDDDGRWGTGYASCILNGIIPVELASFSAEVVDQNVELRWVTASETNNFGFEIQRGTGEGFDEIGFVRGAGTTAIPQIYLFEDKPGRPGRYEYRLKQIDSDGTFEYSQVMTVEITPPRSFVLHQNHPNPFNPETTIGFDLPQATNVRLTIYNYAGQQIRILVNEYKSAGQYNVPWDSRDDAGQRVASGVYFYRIHTESLTAVKALTLVR